MSKTVIELLETIVQLEKQLRWHEVAECYIQILKLEPDHCDAVLGLAELLYKAGAVQESQHLLETGIRLRPQDDDTKYLLGRGWLELGRPVEALRVFQEILEQEPTHYKTLRKMGEFLYQQAKYAEARKYLERLILAHPNDIWALKALMRVLFLLGLVEEAQLVAERAIKNIDVEPSLQAHKYDLLSIYLFVVSHNETYSIAQMFERHCSAMEHLNGNRHCVYKDKPIVRIGVISDSFAQLPVGQCLLPIFQSFDQERFSIVAFSCTKKVDGWTQTFQECSSQWVDCTAMTDKDFAKTLVDSSCDVLIDTFGYANTSGEYYTERFKQFSNRIAPLQFMMIGHPLSMGSTAYDIFIADSVLVPTELEERYFTEKVIRLPTVFAPYAPILPLPEIVSSKRQRIRLGSTHKVAKLSTKTLALWAKVLVAYPKVELLIVRDHLVPFSENRIRSDLMALGVQSHRLMFTSQFPEGDFLQHYNQFDILLDTLHWSGHLTACNSLSMGVPVVTMYGDCSAGRMVSSILQASGNPQWVAASEQQFIEIVGGLIAQDLTQESRTRLRQKFLASGVCDGPRYTNEWQQTVEDCLAERSKLLRAVGETDEEDAC